MSSIITKQNSELHPFEAAHLGKAPFRFIGMNNPKYQSGGLIRETHHKCGGTCDYCGTHIVYEFIIESADGKRFIVGSDCVFKTDNGNLSREVLVQKRKIDKERSLIKKLAPKVAVVNNDIVPYGKYLGEKFSDVAVKDIDYIIWLYQNSPANVLGNAIRNKTKEFAVKELEIRKEAKEKRDQELAVKNALSNFVGVVGDKSEFSVAVEKIIKLDTRFGITRLLIMRDNNSNVFTSFYTGSQDYEAGKTYVIKGTIKEHKDYEGTKQTVLTRIKQI